MRYELTTKNNRSFEQFFENNHDFGNIPAFVFLNFLNQRDSWWRIWCRNSIQNHASVFEIRRVVIFGVHTAHNRISAISALNSWTNHKFSARKFRAKAFLTTLQTPNCCNVLLSPPSYSQNQAGKRMWFGDQLNIYTNLYHESSLTKSMWNTKWHYQITMRTYVIPYNQLDKIIIIAECRRRNHVPSSFYERTKHKQFMFDFYLMWTQMDATWRG